MKKREMFAGNVRTFVVAFDIGEEVVSAISQFARDHEITAAEVIGVGAFERVTLAYWDWQTKDYIPIPISEQVEAVSLIGNLALSSTGNVKLHAHVVVAGRDGGTRGGHLLEAFVRPTLELIVRELPDELRRATDEVTGLALLDL
ncbi:MAG: PPC domain-containing DNA-binding protein [Gemmatimonadota bacterium]